jgi:hypothetical protein
MQKTAVTQMTELKTNVNSKPIIITNIALTNFNARNV